MLREAPARTVVGLRMSCAPKDCGILAVKDLGLLRDRPGGGLLTEMGQWHLQGAHK